MPAGGPLQPPVLRPCAAQAASKSACDLDQPHRPAVCWLLSWACCWGWWMTYAAAHHALTSAARLVPACLAAWLRTRSCCSWRLAGWLRAGSCCGPPKPGQKQHHTNCAEVMHALQAGAIANKSRTVMVCRDCKELCYLGPAGQDNSSSQSAQLVVHEAIGKQQPQHSTAW